MITMKLKITVFASLKDYFDPCFTVEITEGARIENLLEKLVGMKEAAAGILEKCRVAVDSAIVSEEKELKNGEHIFILPPSSGG